MIGTTAAAAAPLPKTVWLCRPGLPNNPCAPGWTTTVIDTHGRVVAVKSAKPATRPVDCFYVYPTVSDQPTPAANFAIDPELRSIALYQTARYSSECRVFAPVYRQLTLTDTLGLVVTPAMRETRYQDVRHAWLDYMQHDNHGRGVVFIGHSQGTTVLRRLIREEVDPNPAVRKKLVSAILLGGNVTVAKGRDRGGDFAHIPACRATGQYGCVVAFSAYNAPAPPRSFFGRAFNPSQEVLCTNPAALGGGSGELDAVYPTQPFAPGTAVGAVFPLLGVPPTRPKTTWVEYRNAYRASCSSASGANVLQTTPLGSSAHPAPVARRLVGRALGRCQHCPRQPGPPRARAGGELGARQHEVVAARCWPRAQPTRR